MTRNSPRMPLLIILVLLLVGVIIAVLASRQTSDVASSPAYAPGAYVSGASLDEWNARHWQWTLSFPVGASPNQDGSGALCMQGQSGDVVFIPRNLPPCTVPEGSVIMIPIAGGECSSVEAVPFWGGDEETLQACAAQEASRYANIAVTVDGEVVRGIERYRSATGTFSAVLPEHNVLGAPAGVAWVAADGYAFLLRPLSAGEHTVIVHTETADGIVLPDKLLTLTVVEPSWSGPARHEVATPLATPSATPLSATTVRSPSTAIPAASPIATPAPD